MDFTTKPALAVSTTMYFNHDYKKLETCPFCGYGTDGPLDGLGKVPYNTNEELFAVSIKCTHCAKHFVALYVHSKDPQTLSYLSCFPLPSGTALHPGLASMSPRFVELHTQAEKAELSGLLDIAAMGYRAAIEVLVKDFAKVELNIPEGEVEQKKLAAAISTYLKEESLINTADVVRILGNDYAHYKRSFPEHDFTILKHYYDIFVRLVTVQYEIRHPPVQR